MVLGYIPCNERIWQIGNRLQDGLDPSIHMGNARMAEGTIKTLTEKGFGFIKAGDDKDLFFHSSSVEGVSFEDLHVGQRVSYTQGQGPKGPRAENVTPI
jgi:cold shock protein